MSFDPDSLYQLLPAVYRLRDAKQGEPLKALLAALATQVGVIEEDLEQLYDDQFIETCADWVVPYIGDVIGWRQLHDQIPKVASPRAEVAHTINYRRRKGTASVLEQLAQDVTGWNACVVEFFQRLVWTQCMNHIRRNSVYAPDLRQWEPLEQIGTPFDSVPRTVDVRRIANGRGKYNISNVGIFLYRLDAYPLTQSPATPAAKLKERCFRFSPLGNDAPLFTRPEVEDQVTHLAQPINVPAPISRRVLAEHLTQYYGEGKSIWIEGVDISVVKACDLSGDGGKWAHTSFNASDKHQVAIDPVLGRMVFRNEHRQPPLVTFHYGFAAQMGGGEYDRQATFDALLTPVETVPKQHATIQDAVNAVSTGGVVEISDTHRYDETLQIKVAGNNQPRLELRAGNQHRPLIELKGEFQINGDAESEITLNGLLITGRKIVVPKQNNELRRLRLVHCTLVPGWTLETDGTPKKPQEASLVVELDGVEVIMDRCITGPLRIAEGTTAQITNSIIDATDAANVAFAAPSRGLTAGGALTIRNSTVIGSVYTRSLDLASNCIFMSPVFSDRKQSGCVRFSYLPLESAVPRRYRCQPATAADTLRVLPQFTSLRYGEPGYGQLAQRTALEIRTGADDESEMGAFHDVFQPQRETNLRVRLNEYLRFGLEAGVFYAT